MYLREHPSWVRWYSLKIRSRKMGMPFVLTRDEFSDWFLKSEKKCAYCDLFDLSLAGWFPGGKKILNFTIDRKNSDLPYSIENICFSCWTCNRLKSDYFTFDEFQEIGQRYIKPRWIGKLEELKSKALSDLVSAETKTPQRFAP